MTSIKVKFRPSTLSHREGVICFQIIMGRKVKLITTRFRIFPNEWNKRENKIQYNTTDIERRNYLFSVQKGIETDYNLLIQSIESLKREGCFALDKIGEFYKKQSFSGNLFSFMEYCIDDLQKADREKTALTYATTLRSFSTFRKNLDIRFDLIDRQIIKEYENWLKDKNITKNTISFYMRVLRAVYNKAVNQGLTAQNLPFRMVYTGIEKTVKRAVNGKIISRLKRLNLENTPQLVFARDMFMFSLYTRGMAFIDMAKLKKRNLHHGYLTYIRSKTGQQLTIKIEPCIQEIINRYAIQTQNQENLLPIVTPKLTYSSALRTQNHRLQTISAKMGLSKPLTSYVARHTWASLAKQNGISIQIISEGMGHENENTTRIYLASLEQSTIDEANATLLSRF